LEGVVARSRAHGGFAVCIVSVVDAMMSILSAQRAYEANAKTVQAADEMLRLANNLERN